MSDFRREARNINMKLRQLRRPANQMFKRAVVALDKGRRFNLDKIAKHEAIFDETHHG
jgi:hypothetical protein